MARKNNMLLWLGLGAVSLYLYSRSAPVAVAAIQTTQSPVEYWFNPSTNALWYEFGGVLTAPQPGMRPASTFEVSSFWPPANHPEFGQANVTDFF